MLGAQSRHPPRGCVSLGSSGSRWPRGCPPRWPARTPPGVPPQSTPKADGSPGSRAQPPRGEQDGGGMDAACLGSGRLQTDCGGVVVPANGSAFASAQRLPWRVPGGRCRPGGSIRALASRVRLRRGERTSLHRAPGTRKPRSRGGWDPTHLFLGVRGLDAQDQGAADLGPARPDPGSRADGCPCAGSARWRRWGGLWGQNLTFQPRNAERFPCGPARCGAVWKRGHLQRGVWGSLRFRNVSGVTGWRGGDAPGARGPDARVGDPIEPGMLLHRPQSSVGI